jgi:hypothetical protein
VGVVLCFCWFLFCVVRFFPCFVMSFVLCWLLDVRLANCWGCVSLTQLGFFSLISANTVVC